MSVIRSFVLLSVLPACLALPAVAAPPKAPACEADAAWAGPPRHPPVTALPSDTLDRTLAMPPGVEAAIQTRLTELLPKAKATAASVSIWKPGTGYLSVRTGQDDPHFWQASVAKMATSAIILQLASEQRLDTSAPIDRWFPNLPGAAAITVSDLLSNTSGLFTFNADPGFRSSNRTWTREELASLAANRPLAFCPGTRFEYSNTGYVLLAGIAEAAGGAPFADLVQTRIVDRLGLTATRLASPTDPQAGLAGLTRTPGAAPATEIASITGAGNLIASTDDTLALLHGWLGGTLTPPDLARQALRQAAPLGGGGLFYGDGVMIYDVPDPQAPATWIGHSGGAPGAGAITVYDVGRDVYLSAAMNAAGPIEALANDLLKTLDAALPD